MNKAIYILLASIVLLVAVNIAAAQPLLPPPPPQSSPIGGLEIMAAVGGAYAIRSLWKQRLDK